MSYPEEIVNLFKKHGAWKTNLFVFIMMCVSIVGAIVFSNGICLVNAMWCGISIFGDYVMCGYKEELELAKATLADVQDDLVVKEHEVERLALELETAQAALVEAKKPRKNYVGYVQTGLAQVESSAIASTIDVAASEAPLPKPKRKPAPRGTRKPKTKNENKD